ncbi:DUF4244 domain-containing protein [Propionibacterium sp.]|uniref:DUF4244 domain-containing protein n=1 Tax=Propionibacterium sp. TaxID=1977903 RepID=UPI0039EBC6F1
MTTHPATEVSTATSPALIKSLTPTMRPALIASAELPAPRREVSTFVMVPPCPTAVAIGRTRRNTRLARARERGMATAEYAVGILAAVALALVVLRIVTDNSFFSRLLRIVLQILQRVGGMIGS